MKRFMLWLALLMAAPLAYGQSGVGPGQPSRHSPDCDFSFTFTGAGRSTYASLGSIAGTPAGYDNRSESCTTWTLVYSSTGFSAVSIELDEAPDATPGVPGTWVVHPNPAGGTVLPLTSTTGGQATCYRYFPWISVNLNSVTGSGLIKGRVLGYRPFTDKDSSLIGGASSANVTDVQGPAAAGVPPVGNPVLIGGSDSTNVQTIRTSTIGGIQLAATAGVALSDVMINTVRQLSVDTGSLIGYPTFGLLFNGASWERGRAASSDLGRTGNAEVTRAHNFTYITTAVTTTVKGTGGILHRIVVNTPTISGTIIITNIAAAGCTGATAANVATITLPSTITSESPFAVDYDAIMPLGICVRTTGANDVTVIWE